MTQADRVFVMELVHRAAEVYGVTPERVMGASRERDVADARHVVMYALVRNHGWTLKRVARCFSRDHTSVVHAVRKVDGMLDGHDVMGEPLAVRAEREVMQVGR